MERDPFEYTKQMWAEREQKQHDDEVRRPVERKLAEAEALLVSVRGVIDRVMADDDASRGETKIAEELDGIVPARSVRVCEIFTCDRPVELGTRYCSDHAPPSGPQIVPVILESPYAGDVERNVCYLRACLRDSLLRNEAPFASHAIYTQPGVLDDTHPPERTRGIVAGFAWKALAVKTVVYEDLGVSPGMRLAVERSRELGQTIECRRLGESWSQFRCGVCCDRGELSRRVVCPYCGGRWAAREDARAQAVSIAEASGLEEP